MSRSLSRLAGGLLILLVALLVQMTRIQVLQADELNAPSTPASAGPS